MPQIREKNVERWENWKRWEYWYTSTWKSFQIHERSNSIVPSCTRYLMQVWALFHILVPLSFSWKASRWFVDYIRFNTLSSARYKRNWKIFDICESSSDRKRTNIWKGTQKKLKRHAENLKKYAKNFKACRKTLTDMRARENFGHARFADTLFSDLANSLFWL